MKIKDLLMNKHEWTKEYTLLYKFKNGKTVPLEIDLIDGQNNIIFIQEVKND